MSKTGEQDQEGGKRGAQEKGVAAHGRKGTSSPILHPAVKEGANYFFVGSVGRTGKTRIEESTSKRNFGHEEYPEV